MNTTSGTQEIDFPGSNTTHKSGDAGQELLTIIIEQGTIVSFRQCTMYPSLEGVYGEGI